MLKKLKDVLAVRKIMKIGRSEKAFKPRKVIPSITCVGLTSFLATQFPVRQFLLAPWLPLQGLAMVYAPRGVGKTFFALWVAVAVATGGRFLKWSAPRPRGVLIIDGEMPGVVLQERLKGIVKSVGVEMADLPVRLITPDLQEEGMINLADYEHQQHLQAYMEGVDLIIVDNIATLCRSGRENESEGWLSVQQWAIAQRAAGRSVLFVHHAGKSGQQRGTSSREDVLDTVIALKEPTDYSPTEGAVFEVHFEKNRGFYGKDAEGFKASLVENSDGTFTWSMDALSSDTYDQVVALARQGCPRKLIAQQLGIHKSGVSRHLARAAEEGLLKD